MDSQTRILIGAIVVLSLIVASVYLAPTIDERFLKPRLERSWVAIEVAGRGIADVGVVRLEAGTPFTLHAVLEAVDRDGRSIYYTAAAGLRFLAADGTPRAVPAEAVRPWDRQATVRHRWFTVEGRQPYLPLAAGEGAETHEMQLFYRPDWQSAWSIPGSVEPAFDDRLDLGSRLDSGAQTFGTQRYHVRIELYSNEDAVLPDRRLPSPDPEALRRDPATFPTVIAALPSAAAPASTVFGLTAIEPPAEVDRALRSALTRLADQGLAFTRLTVLRDQLRVTEDPWLSVDLDTAPRWGEAVAAGDLLRVGERVVVLYADRGAPGVLDYEDLCFDFVAGATVRMLADVFSGEDPVLEHRRARKPAEA